MPSSSAAPYYLLSHLQSAFRSGSILVGSAVTVKGWVRSVRTSKSVVFVVVNDGSCLHSLQVVMTREDAKRFTNGSSIQATGTIALLNTSLPPASLSLQHLELHPTGPAALLGASPPSYPISKQQLTLEYLRDNLHLRLRTNTLSSLARIRSAAFHAFHAQLASLSFLHVHTCPGPGRSRRRCGAPRDGPRRHGARAWRTWPCAPASGRRGRPPRGRDAARR